jgi:hypothetical protein
MPDKESKEANESVDEIEARILTQKIEEAKNQIKLIQQGITHMQDMIDHPWHMGPIDMTEINKIVQEDIAMGIVCPTGKCSVLNGYECPTCRKNRRNWDINDYIDKKYPDYLKRGKKK